MFAANARGSEGFDYSYGAGARTVPKGVSLNGEAGYGRLLWGNNGDGEVMYGYVRPVARARTSLVVNAAEAELQVAPVSFLVLSAGAGFTSRNVDTATADCAAADCRGSLGSQFTGGTLLLGAGGWVAGADLRLSWMRPLEPSAASRDFVDEDSALAGRGGGDRLLSHRFFLSLRMDRRWALGGFASAQQMNNSSASNRSQGIFVRMTEGMTTVTTDRKSVV